MKLAAIDIGSNSVHMIVVDVAGDGSFRVIDREKDMVGLGRGTLEANHLDEGAMARGIESLGRFAKLALRHRVHEVLAVATSAVREALNGGVFIERVRRSTGIGVNVITAMEEARLIGLAAHDGIDLGEQRALVIDVGGGSVEMLLFERGKLVSADSSKLGVIRLAEAFLGTDGTLAPKARRRLVDRVREFTGDFVARTTARKLDLVVGTSGTILTLGALATGTTELATESLNGHAVPLADLAALADELVGMSARERGRLEGVDARRSDTLAVGAALVVELLGRLGVKEIVLCDRALREGLVVDWVERNRERLGRIESVPNLKLRSVLELAERCGYDARHARQVAGFALTLFDRTQRVHGLGPELRPFLEYAALLHDVGTHIAFTRHQRHGYYLVKNGGLRGFRPDEVELLAGCVLYHRKAEPKSEDACVRLLGKAGRRAVEVLAGILRIADGLDRTHFQVVQDLQVRISGEVVSVSAVAGDDAELEVWAAARKARLFERVTGTRLRVRMKLTPGRRSGAPGAGEAGRGAG